MRQGRESKGEAPDIEHPEKPRAPQTPTPAFSSHTHTHEPEKEPERTKQEGETAGKRPKREMTPVLGRGAGGTDRR